MKRFSIMAGILIVGLAGPALAQQAPAGPAPTGQAAAPPPVRARDLMPPEERASLRSQMRQATPEQRAAIWAQKRAELEQRAAARGQVLAEPAAGRAGGKGEEGRGRRNDGGRGEHGSGLARVFSWGPRAS